MGFPVFTFQGAACTDPDVPADLFFDGDGERGESKRQRQAAAKRICAGCPVIDECLEWALEFDDSHAVLGGTNRDERAAIKARGTRPCDRCGKQFTVDRPGKRYCTRICQRSAGTSRHRAKVRELVAV
jgi:WhiB family redox-sensing transcriptional regulator